ncbi:indole-3-acetaldehyde oxidase isoform X1 [Ziziphus jujuba]|uniref:Indole-3-acetaldehyde oxidase isoform X1 n=2 Tax=Ziziphus jujuba TaxID=326968 RepID=A0ABM3IB22_ZIZJJ|nr:indole-3-acetaldehyde oxidase isoform X1 [Ziziphus jujuba]
MIRYLTFALNCYPTMAIRLVSQTRGVLSKMGGTQTATGNLVFAVNGERFELPTIDPSTTLLEFLRSHTPFKSVKLSCGEGGCGACVALLSKYDPVLDKVEDFTVSSCLTLLCSVNRCSITTSEGLGNSRNGFHAIHKRFTGFHASQCGYCTPGMCVSLFGALVNAEKTNRLEPPPPFSKLTVFEAEKAVAGNICRCTGYRPIADACKSLAADVDIEDLGLNSFWRKEHSKEEKISKLPVYDRNDEVCTFPEFLKMEIRSGISFDSKRYNWYTPASVEELQNLLNFDEGTGTKIVVSNTGMGYYKELEPYDRYIDLKHIPELSMLRIDQTGVEIGAAVTISKIIETLKNENQHEFRPTDRIILQKLANHMEKIATGFIRSTASVGGNLVMAQRKYFPSDIAAILLAVDSTVDIMSGHQFKKITLEEFLEGPPLDSNSILISVKIPNWASVGKLSPENNTTLLFETYRASPRPLGNALPYLNAAFLAEVSPTKTSDGVLVNHCQMAFGAYGTKHAIRARTIEKFLTGKLLSSDVLYKAIKLVRAAVVPEDGTANPAYRSSLAAGFLFEFFSSLIDSGTEISNGFSNGYTSTSLFKHSKPVQNNNQHYPNKIPTMLSSGKQVLQLSKSYNPVGEPITKSGAAIQASGEAVYVDDIPSPVNCLHGAFIYSRKPLAWVKSIKLNQKPFPDGVAAVISSKDIPDHGKNVGSRTGFGAEPLFADDQTHCAGQRVALVVADTQKLADMAANSAVVSYGMENLEPPILSVEEAVKRSSFFDVPPFFRGKPVGDISKGMDEADNKIVSAEIRLGSQYYFYMETQTALAIADEDNCIVVYSSVQCPEYAHGVIAKCLGVPAHNVRVITRRVGGGFGGKAMHAMPIATACALAAQKLQRPVRMYLNRKTDMIVTGGRHPMKITYTVGFKSDGKITALQLEILIDAGIAIDVSPIIVPNVLNGLKKYDWGALSFDIKLCKTNSTSKSAMRAPGEVQGSYIAEAIIERVASTLSLEVDSVRNVNLHTYNSLKSFYEGSAGEPVEYTLPSIWDQLAVSSSFNQRIEMMNEFNRRNKWKKRGISRVPIVHEVLLRPTPGKVSILNDGSVVVEVGGIELGQGLWTKVKQMVAYALSLIQCNGDGDLLDKVRVIQADTLSLIQGGLTAGSTTSESSCEVVRLCCNILVERLTTLKEKLQKQTGNVQWETLISKAYMQSVNLSASSYYIPDTSSNSYLNYGAAVSEVEVNLLTGETTILQVDLIYDCGQSLNPAVDLGQIEGAFVQGVGFFMSEEYLTNSDGLLVSDSTWTYKVPSMDTIPKQFNVEILNSGHHEKRILSSKASGEPPLLLAVSVHGATSAAIKEARKQLLSWSSKDGSESIFQLDVPATMPVVKEFCGLDIVEKYLEWTIASSNN